MSHVISSENLLEVINRQKNNNGADFTIRSKRTGKDYTYSISRSLYNGNWYTHVKVETEYLKFVRLGTYFNGSIRHKGKVVDCPSAIAIAYVLAKVELKSFTLLDTMVEVMHTGKCLVCSKTLTDADSIAFGLGPICRTRN
jgi:hypothetical protein